MAPVARLDGSPGPVKPIVVMALGSLGSWLAVTAGGGSAFNPELALGMAGPLASAGATWLVVQRAHAAAPERVMNVMVAGFLIKLLFFGAYVGLVGALALRPGPFVISFAAYFIVLMFIEALYLRQLFAGPPALGAAKS